MITAPTTQKRLQSCISEDLFILLKLAGINIELTGKHPLLSRNNFHYLYLFFTIFCNMFIYLLTKKVFFVKEETSVCIKHCRHLNRRPRLRAVFLIEMKTEYSILWGDKAIK